MENSNFVKGINIIAKYIPEKSKDSFNICCEHDQLWFGVDTWIDDEADRVELYNLGWVINENSWCANI